MSDPTKLRYWLELTLRGDEWIEIAIAAAVAAAGGVLVGGWFGRALLVVAAGAMVALLGTPVYFWRLSVRDYQLSSHRDRTEGEGNG